MTETPTSVAPTVRAPGRSGSETVARFGTTERAVHWVHATSALGLLASGLVLYLPPLGVVVGNRPLVKAVHLAIAAVWLTALCALVVAGDRRRLGRTRRELERFTD